MILEYNGYAPDLDGYMDLFKFGKLIKHDEFDTKDYKYLRFCRSLNRDRLSCVVLYCFIKMITDGGEIDNLYNILKFNGKEYLSINTDDNIVLCLEKI